MLSTWNKSRRGKRQILIPCFMKKIYMKPQTWMKTRIHQLPAWNLKIFYPNLYAMHFHLSVNYVRLQYIYLNKKIHITIKLSIMCCVLRLEHITLYRKAHITLHEHTSHYMLFFSYVNILQANIIM